MMNKLLFIVALVFAVCVTPAFAQEMPVCGKGSGLEWDVNTEPDIKEYVMWAATVESQIYYIMGTVQHDPSKIVVREDGSSAIQGGYLTVKDGPTEFFITAKDQAGNESDPSEHVICNVQLPPGSPTGLKVVIQFVNP